MPPHDDDDDDYDGDDDDDYYYDDDGIEISEILLKLLFRFYYLNILTL